MSDSESGRIGIILPDIYDGISVWQEPDGTLTNRWDWAAEHHPAELAFRRRRELARSWIDRQKDVR